MPISHNNGIEYMGGAAARGQQGVEGAETRLIGANWRCVQIVGVGLVRPRVKALRVNNTQHRPDLASRCQGAIGQGLPPRPGATGHNGYSGLLRLELLEGPWPLFDD